MKTLKFILSVSCLFASPAFADSDNDYDDQYQGPGQMQVEVRREGSDRGNEYYAGYGRQHSLEKGSGICYAIKHQKNMQMVVETKDVVNKKEMKVNTKIYIIEPYAFGITSDGKPVIRGIVKDDKQFKEVTVKYGSDRFDDKMAAADKDKKDKDHAGWFPADTSWYSGSKGKNISFEDIKSLKVIEDSHFDAPKKYKGLSEEGVQVICQVPITNES